MFGRAQRRLAAIVSTDVVGYSRLMGADETGTLARMKAHRAELWNPQIEKYGGRVVGTAGDALLVEFASAVSAVECSLAVQQGMAEREADQSDETRMLLRIGVNIGEVVIDGDDIFGDGVNIAARLQSIAPAGGICLSGKVHDEIAGKIAAAFEDAGAQEVKNIARPVQVWRWLPSAPTMPPSPPGARRLPPPDKPSIAVLSFTNMSGDPDQEYLSDGIAEDIITELSRFRSLMVIARNSSFTYKGRNVDLKQVATELGVRYVLEGSVRKGGNRVRVTGQLIDAETGSHIWAERYDRDLDDIFALQDEIASAIVGVVGAELDRAERNRAVGRPSNSLNAWELYQRGMWHLWRFTDADLTMAAALFANAIDVDANFGAAHSGIAAVCSARLLMGWTEDPDELLRRGLDAAKTAISIDEKDAAAHLMQSRLEANRANYETAIPEARRAVELNPNLAAGWYALGAALTWADQHEEAAVCLDRAMRLSPNDPLRSAFLGFRALAAWHLDGPAAALPWVQQASRDPKSDTWPDIFATAFHVELGQADEARRAVARVLEKRPNMRVSLIAEMSSGARYARKKQLLANLREAGLPE